MHVASEGDPLEDLEESGGLEHIAGNSFLERGSVDAVVAPP